MIEIEKCLKVIKSGGIILYPTDTIYGLGCDAYNLNAIRKINIIKGSDPEKPLIYLMNDSVSYTHLTLPTILLV